MARILEEEMGKGAFPAVLHCFTGGRELARRAIALGLYISFTGILTFKKSDELRAIASRAAGRSHSGRDRRALSGARPYRGKRNEPAYVVETAKVLAETRGVSLDEIARQTTENFFRLFRKVPRAGGPICARAIGMSLKFTILGCGSSAACRGRRSAGARAIPTIRRTAGGGSLLVERHERGRRHARAGRYLARSARAAPRRRGRLARRRALSPTSMPTTPTASTTCGRCSSRGAAASMSTWTSPRRALHARFGYCFGHGLPVASGSEYPPIVTEHRLEAGRPSPSTGRAVRSCPAHPAGARRYLLRSASVSAPSPIPAT